MTVNSRTRSHPYRPIAANEKIAFAITSAMRTPTIASFVGKLNEVGPPRHREYVAAAGRRQFGQAGSAIGKRVPQFEQPRSRTSLRADPHVSMGRVSAGRGDDLSTRILGGWSAIAA